MVTSITNQNPTLVGLDCRAPGLDIIVTIHFMPDIACDMYNFCQIKLTLPAACTSIIPSKNRCLISQRKRQTAYLYTIDNKAKDH